MERYEIKVRGQIDRDWSSWLGDMEIKHSEDGMTVLSGELIDQVALFSVLSRIRDMGLTLIEVKKISI
ncbi:MAG: hypothetical protein GX457_12510 [Thermotogaceae bacterium]|nr:hypothetical protein [Thermotogaceae bacterium]